jgi:hypothetical protein
MVPLHHHSMLLRFVPSQCRRRSSSVTAVAAAAVSQSRPTSSAVRIPITSRTAAPAKKSHSSAKNPAALWRWWDRSRWNTELNSKQQYCPLSNAMMVARCCFGTRSESNNADEEKAKMRKAKDSNCCVDNEKDKPSTVRNNSNKTSDPPYDVKSWVERALPNQLLPYARLARVDKPIGTMLLVS